MAEYRKKLIEVALPLEAINKESMHEKSVPRRGHPATMHLWWARRPLAACRAVLFSSLVDDPSSHPEEFPTVEKQDQERQRLFRVIERLVKWENTTNEDVLREAREEILKSTNGNPPPVYDPFCGGGSIPLEAQRLGLEAHASDLNPVAVLITKALIEIPPKFAGMPPVNPEARRKTGYEGEWKGAQGLAEDVRYYGKWMRDQAEKRIGHLYPKVRVPSEQGGGEATVIAWIWARTVKCPNPACGARMPLVKTFWLSNKKNRQAWIEPIIDKSRRTVRFEVRTGEGIPQDCTVNRNGACCIVCGTPVPLPHIRSEGRAGRMDAQLMAIVAEGKRGRVYLPANEEHTRVADNAKPNWKPTQELQGKCRVSVPLYGMNTFGDLFTPRQLTALTTFSDLVGEALAKIKSDAIEAGMPAEDTGINDSGIGARDYVENYKSMIQSYANATLTYLALSISRWSELSNSLASWNSTNQNIRGLFANQAIPMIWNFAEISPFGPVGPINSFFEFTSNIIKIHCSNQMQGRSFQLDSTQIKKTNISPLISTDPPYYDNISFADLSDFFYIWLRKSISNIYPDLFTTMFTPKDEELGVFPARCKGGKQEARQFFEEGLFRSFSRMRAIQHSDYPLTVYYAYKQSETKSKSRVSTGWETMLEGLIRAGFKITGTWPMRTERGARSNALETNALASSIVLVCRPRPEDAPLTTRGDFIRQLKGELPKALKEMQKGSIAPVDLAQAAIGPGMAIFSRYSKVVEADGKPMSVRTALALINEALDDYLTADEGEYDADTRWALAWFEQFGLEAAAFGEAETLSKAKNISVEGLVEAGILEAKGGKVRLLKREELSQDWDPLKDTRLPVWELTQRLINALRNVGETGAAEIYAKVRGLAETARDLAYRLYSVCERKKWAREAVEYNSLVVAWPEIVKLANRMTRPTPEQEDLFEG